MGCSIIKENSFEASVTVSAGQHSSHCCFAVLLKADVFRPKFAVLGCTYTVTPCSGEALYDKYGVGTKFAGTAALGIPEVLIITKATYPCAVTINYCGNVDYEYTIEAVSADSARVSLSVKGPRVKYRKQATEMQLEVMKSWIEANVEEILASTPVQG